MNPSHKKVLKKVRNYLSKETNFNTKPEESSITDHNDCASESLTMIRSHEQHHASPPNKSEVLILSKLSKEKPGSTTILKCNPKTIEEFLDENYHNSSQKLKIKLVESTPTGLKDTLLIEYKLYVKYQIHVHHDKEEECTLEQFKRFLVNSPLQVVVLDILPLSVFYIILLCCYC
jgi:arginine-tRNA-protein transferase